MKPSLNDRGFTLIEVFAAMVVFALGLLALSKLQVTSIATNSFALQMTEAMTVAQSTMERLIALSYLASDLADTDGDGTNQDANMNGIDDDDEGINTDGIHGFGLADATVNTADHVLAGQGPKQRYTVYWNIAVDEPIPRTKTIRVIVTYTDQKNRLHQSVLECSKTDVI